jgi:zinc transporter ZupT
LSPLTIGAPLAAALVAIFCGFAGIALAGGRRVRYIVPASGLLLSAVALFGLIPELAGQIGWAPTLALAAVSYGVLTLLDMRGYAVCPSCSHGEKFAGSLVTATAVHAFIDGWGIAASRDLGAAGAAITFAILLHKAPEGLALGSLLRQSTTRTATAFGLCIAAEVPTVAGGAVGFWGTPPEWMQYVLAAVSGMFLFLGVHAISAAKGQPEPTVPAA